MVSCDQFHPSAPRLCLDDGKESLRAAALAEIDQHLDNLKRCLHWLVAMGITIIDVDMRRGRAAPWVQVAASSYLHTLFLGDCAADRIPDGHLVRHRWKTNRFGIQIWWEEVSCE